MGLFETYLYEDDQTINTPVRGTGSEPTSLNQIKVCAMVFEEDWEHVVDIEWPKNVAIPIVTANLLGCTK